MHVSSGGDGDADAFQFGFQLRQLIRLPLTFVGLRRCGADQGHRKY